METQGYLIQLSTELLIKIFSYLDISDLCKLRRTCKRFNEVINCWDHVLLKNLYPLVTNQENSIFLSRCEEYLPILEKIRISKNWQQGMYKEKAFLFVKRKYMPWLHLNDKSVWISRGKHIFCYDRYNKYVNVSRPRHVYQGRSTADVGHFQIKNNFLISGQRDGSIWLTTLHDKKVIFDQEDCHESDINSVDISQNGNIIVSGSRDSSFKVWKVDYGADTDVLKKLYSEIFYDRVLRVSLLNEQPLLAVGTSGTDYRAPLFVYDIERILHPVELSVSRYGSGVLDLKWDGPHTIWSCGYDSCLRRWDLRTGKSEQNFYDPHASVMYCLEYDYYNTIMTGNQSHGRVVLWDVRQPSCVQIKKVEYKSCTMFYEVLENDIKKSDEVQTKWPQVSTWFFQMEDPVYYYIFGEDTSRRIQRYKLFFMGSCKGDGNTRSSPIYSLSFDSESLFTVTDRNLNVLNFSVYNGIKHDYSFCWK